MTTGPEVAAIRNMRHGAKILPEPAGKRRLSAAGPGTSEQFRLQREMDAAMSRFLQVEVEVGQAFAKAAMGAGGTQEVLHNRRLARKAYDTILRLMEKTRLTVAQEDTLGRELETLRLRLYQLGDPI